MLGRSVLSVVTDMQMSNPIEDVLKHLTLPTILTPNISLSGVDYLVVLH